MDLLGLQADSGPEPNATVSDFIDNNKGWNVTKLQQYVQNQNILLKIKWIDIPFTVAFGSGPESACNPKRSTRLNGNVNPFYFEQYILILLVRE